jgi:light-regulated signal transduction histidine kinase (bacteriophytochrome)
MQTPNYDSELCGSLPIHLTNMIQPYGVLLVIGNDHKIVQASENADKVFGSPVSKLINSDLATHIPKTAYAVLASKLRNEFNEKIPAVWEIGSLQFLVLIHKKENYLLAEIDLSPIDEGQQDTFIDVYHELKYAMSSIEKATSIGSVCRTAAAELKRISGFDKVMIYRFDPEWNGFVIAEEMESGMESYNGFTFPASDIPKQARQLYLKNPYRLIPDRNYQPVKLSPVINPITSSFIDLSDCNLRSVAAVHLEYLRNMDVTASMSTRILFQDNLWGLIACHHRAAKHLSYEMCSVFEMLSGIISMKVASLQNQAAHDFQNFIKGSYAHIVEMVFKTEDLMSSLMNDDGVVKLFGATGAVIAKGGRFFTAGVTPSDDLLEELVLWLHTRELKRAYATDCLGAEYEYAKEFSAHASGLLVIPINSARDHYLMMFRSEKIRVINWGGNPESRIQFEKNERNYHPRNSFKQWQQKVRGYSTPWLKEELEIAEVLRSFIYEHETAPVQARQL